MQNTKRISADKIEKLNTNEIYVFPSNLLGSHGEKEISFGAIRGFNNGIQGLTYAIPIKDLSLNLMNIEDVQRYIDIFIKFAKQNKHLTFIVSSENWNAETGISKENLENVLFSNAIDVFNIYLPETFFKIN